MQQSGFLNPAPRGHRDNARNHKQMHRRRRKQDGVEIEAEIRQEIGAADDRDDRQMAPSLTSPLSHTHTRQQPTRLQAPFSSSCVLFL